MARKCMPRAMLGCVRARGFLSGLSDRTTGDSCRRSQKWQRVVPFPRRIIYGVVADVGSYAEFLPYCVSSKVVERNELPDGSSSLETEVRMGFMTMQSQFTSTVALVSLERIVAVSMENEHLEELSFSWDFTPMGKQACRLDLQLGFSLRAPEHGLIWDLAKDRVVSEYLQAFQRRCAVVEALSEGT